MRGLHRPHATRTSRSASSCQHHKGSRDHTVSQGPGKSSQKAIWRLRRPGGTRSSAGAGSKVREVGTPGVATDGKELAGHPSSSPRSVPSPHGVLESTRPVIKTCRRTKHGSRS